MTNCNRGTRAPLDDGVTERSMSASARTLRPAGATCAHRRRQAWRKPFRNPLQHQAEIEQTLTRYGADLFAILVRWHAFFGADREAGAVGQQGHNTNRNANGAPVISRAAPQTERPAPDPGPLRGALGGNRSRCPYPSTHRLTAVARYLEPPWSVGFSAHSVRARGKLTR
jgi:hypothetical protein